jgi:hypothetical protein
VKFFVPNRKGTEALEPRKAEREWKSIAGRLDNVTPRWIYRLRVNWRARTADFVVGAQDPFGVADEQDRTGAELLTVAIFAVDDGYVVCCRHPESRWGSHLINVAVDDVIESEDFED